MKNKILAYFGLLGLVTLGAILYAIRDRIIAAGPWLWELMEAAIIALTAYAAYKLYVAFRLEHHKLVRSQLEIAAQRQDLLGQETTRQIALGQFALGSHLARTRIYPDAKGYMPVLANDDMRQLPAQLDLLMLPQVNRGREPRLLPAPDDQGSSMGLPSSVRYEDIARQIPTGHSCLGISERGLETCDFKDLMTMLICGGSSTGKSNTVAIKLYEAMQIGRNTHIIVIDPHMTKPDSLYNKVKQYAHRFLMPVARNDEETIATLRWFKQEFERRLELSTEELEELDDILLVCDEVYALCFHREDKEISRLLKIVSGIAGYESRGYGMYAWFLTQRVTGLKWLRDAVMTTICHKMQSMAERVLAANDDREVARDMNNWTMPGRVAIYGLNLATTVTQMPFKVVEASAERDDMEPLAPNPRRDVFGTTETPRYIEVDPGFGYDRDGEPGVFSGAKMGVRDDVRTFANSITQPPVRLPDASSDDRPSAYRFADEEIPQFLAAWRASGNVDKACQALHKSAPRYRAHAKEILAAHNLRQVQA
jgi:hypothetical protein